MNRTSEDIARQLREEAELLAGPSAREHKLEAALVEIFNLRTYHYGATPDGELPSTDCEEADAFRTAVGIAGEALR